MRFPLFHFRKVRRPEPASPMEQRFPPTADRDFLIKTGLRRLHALRNDPHRMLR